MSVKQHLSDIIAASFLDNLDQRGERELNEWLNKSQANKDFYESMKSRISDKKTLLELRGYDPVKDWSKVKQRVAGNRRRVRTKKYLCATAAAGLLALFTVLLLPRTGTQADVSVDEVGQSAVPINYQAVLVLPTGEAFDLSNKMDFQDGKIRNDGTELQYDSLPMEVPQETGPEIHTVKVPRGAEYKIRLADGSLIHLNADSELRYPAHFDGENRTVELIGEAYFDIAPDVGKPFVIENREMTITVIGTSFNFKAYQGEQRRVTVESGRVLVRLGNTQFEAGPGIQVYETDGGLSLREVNTSTHISWRNNRFFFSSETLGNVIMEIGRWYDLEISFSEDKLKDLRFTADLPKYDSIDKIADIINQTLSVNVQLEGGKLVIISEQYRPDI